MPSAPRVVAVDTASKLVLVFGGEGIAGNEIHQAGGTSSFILMMFELEGDAFERDEEVLKGTPPADLPIERAVKFDLVVNLKSAKMLGIELPTSLLIRALSARRWAGAARQTPN